MHMSISIFRGLVGCGVERRGRRTRFGISNSCRVVSYLIINQSINQSYPPRQPIEHLPFSHSTWSRQHPPKPYLLMTALLPSLPPAVQSMPSTPSTHYTVPSRVRSPSNLLSQMTNCAFPTLSPNPQLKQPLLQPALRDMEHAQVQCEWERHLEHTSPWLYRHLRCTAAPHCA